MALPDSLEELLENFDVLDDWQDRYRYIIELGNELDPLDDVFKTDAYKVEGCMSQVWLRCTESDDGERLIFTGDGDAAIVKGLIAILFTAFSNRTPDQILAVDMAEAFKKLDLEQHLSPGRSNGLFAMVKRIQGHAQDALAA